MKTNKNFIHYNAASTHVAMLSSEPTAISIMLVYTASRPIAYLRSNHVIDSNVIQNTM